MPMHKKSKRVQRPPEVDACYTCDHCGEEIVIPLDRTEGNHQEYVEDCPVCCHPHLIHVDFEGEEARVWADAEA